METIVDYMGEEYKKKLPLKILRKIVDEKKYGYKPDFDFSKPLAPQVTRQETKNLIAYLYLNYWCDNEEDKNMVLAQIEKNKAKQKEIDEQNRQEEIKRKAMETPQSLDAALKSRFKK